MSGRRVGGAAVGWIEECDRESSIRRIVYGKSDGFSNFSAHWPKALRSKTRTSQCVTALCAERFVNGFECVLAPSCLVHLVRAVGGVFCPRFVFYFQERVFLADKTCSGLVRLQFLYKKCFPYNSKPIPFR